MKATASLLLALAAVGAPGPVRAQMTGNIESIEGRAADALTLPFSAAECDGNVAVTMRFRMVPDRNQLDFWRGTGTTDCSTEAARAPDTRTCTPLTIGTDTTISGATEVPLTVTVGEILDCTGSDGDFRVYALAASGAATTEPIPDGEFVYFDLTLKRTGPSAPSGLTGEDGENVLTVRWTSSESDLREQRIYVSAGGCPAGGSDGGTAGWTLYDTLSGDASSATVDPDSIGLMVGDEAGIGVTSVDQAGNESALSTVCVTRIETTGFCEHRGGCPNDCSVGRVGAGGAPGPSAFVLVLAAGCAILRRRRRP